jgi:hypothetical protein
VRGVRGVRECVSALVRQCVSAEVRQCGSVEVERCGWGRSRKGVQAPRQGQMNLRAGNAKSPAPAAARPCGASTASKQSRARAESIPCTSPKLGRGRKRVARVRAPRPCTIPASAHGTDRRSPSPRSLRGGRGGRPSPRRERERVNPPLGKREAPSPRAGARGTGLQLRKSSSRPGWACPCQPPPKLGEVASASRGRGPPPVRDPCPRARTAVLPPPRSLRGRAGEGGRPRSGGRKIPPSSKPTPPPDPPPLPDLTPALTH